MTGNRITVLVKYGVIEYPVTVEFTSVRIKDGIECAVFKVVEPIEKNVGNQRFFIPVTEQQNLDWIFREAFDILARFGTQHFKKRAESYRGGSGIVPELESLQPTLTISPTQFETKPVYATPEEEWLLQGRYNRLATPPTSNWVWGEPIKQWYKLDQNQP